MKTTDETIMPFGQHKGRKLANVPAGYLLWLFDNNKLENNPDIKEYIEENYDILYEEIMEEGV